MSNSIPVFILFYSPYCGHCIRMHPAWISFMNKYENDTGILVAEVDCYNMRKVANKLARIDGYPTIMFVEKGVFTEVSVARTEEAFAKKAEELKTLFGTKTCKVISSSKEINYPAFLLRAKGNKTNSCVAVSNISRISGWDKKDFYVMVGENITQNMFEFFVSENVSTLYNGNSTDDMIQFVKDLMVKNLDNWKLKDVLNNFRKIVYILYENGVDLVAFRSILNQNADRLLFGKIDIKKFNKKYSGIVNISSTDLPALMFYEKEENLFKLVPKLTKFDDFNRAVVNARNGTIDSKIIFKAKLDEEDFSKYRLLFGISVCLFTIILMGIWILVFLNDSDSLDKLE